MGISWVKKHYLSQEQGTWYIFKSTYDPLNYQTFSRHGAMCIREYRNIYRLFIERTKSSLTSNPLKFCDFVRKNCSACAVPKTGILNCISRNNDQETVDMFDSYFSYIYFSTTCVIQTLRLPFLIYPITRTYPRMIYFVNWLLYVVLLPF